ncbi:MAG: transglutaminase domain-containing protein [Candidatus Omnitrophota bacterium]|jgi:hypothetical protein
MKANKTKIFQCIPLLSLLATSIYSFNVNKNLLKFRKETQELEKSYSSGRGIDQRVLKVLGENEKRQMFEDSEQEKRYFESVNQEEIDYKFRKLGYMEGLNSVVEFMKTYNYNNNLISILSKELKETKRKPKNKLEELILECEKINKTTKDYSLKRTERIYNAVSRCILYRMETEGTKDVNYVIENSRGDCSEFVSTLCAFYSNYNVCANIKFGEAKGKEKEEGTLHTWLKIFCSENEEQLSFDIDPSHYSIFVPLKQRGNF